MPQVLPFPPSAAVHAVTTRDKLSKELVAVVANVSLLAQRALPLVEESRLFFLENLALQRRSFGHIDRGIDSRFGKKLQNIHTPDAIEWLRNQTRFEREGCADKPGITADAGGAFATREL